MPDSLWLSPGVCSNSHPSSQWWHPTISSSLIALSSCPQLFPVWGSFPMNCLVALGGQSVGTSASASILPMNIQDWSSLGLTGWISLLLKGLFNSLLQHHSWKASILPVWVNNYTFKEYSFRLKCESRPAISVGKLHSACYIRTKPSFISAGNLKGLLVLGNLKT